VKRRGDEQKLAEVLQRMTSEDPSLGVEHDPVTHEAVIRGLGELHVGRVLERIRSQYKLEVDAHPPTIPYRETIAAAAEGHHRHKKQSGGAGQFGEVFLRVAPLARGEGFRFVDEVKGGAIPSVFIPAVEKGVRQALSGGAVAGFPVQDVQVTVYDGKSHPVDGKEIAFITAGKRAFVDAVQKAKPVLLEPYVLLEITVPSKYMGDITGHLSTKRARVQSSDMIGPDVCLIKAHAPLGELQNYSNELKSMTGGAGTYAMEYSHDERTPSNIQALVVAAYKPKAEQD